MSTTAAETQEQRREPMVRQTFTLPPDIEEGLKRRASRERRSMSAHVAWLIEQDMRRAESAEGPVRA